MQEIYILAGARTPVGVLQGSLSDVSAIDLGVVAAREALERRCPPAEVRVELGSLELKFVQYFHRFVSAIPLRSKGRLMGDRTYSSPCLL